MTDLIKAENIQEINIPEQQQISTLEEENRYTDVYNIPKEDLKQIKNFNVN